MRGIQKFKHRPDQAIFRGAAGVFVLGPDCNITVPAIGMTGISLSPESQRHTRMAGLNQYQEIVRSANFYGTLVLDRGECVDFKYV